MAYPSTVTEIETRIRQLATTHSAICKRSDLKTTFEPAGTGRKISLLTIGTGTGEGRARVLIVAGVHAREWAPPDAVLTFIEKLLVAYNNGTPNPITYAQHKHKLNGTEILLKSFTIPAPDVRKMIKGLELYVIPCANPDGRAFTMKTGATLRDKFWRRNRRPAPAGTTCPALPANPPPFLSTIRTASMSIAISRSRGTETSITARVRRRTRR